MPMVGEYYPFDRSLRDGNPLLVDLNPRPSRRKGATDHIRGKTGPVLIVKAQALLDVEHPSTLIIPLVTQLIYDAEP